MRTYDEGKNKEAEKENAPRSPSRRIVLAITGASGAMYAARLIDLLATRQSFVQVALVFSRNARSVWAHELGHIPDLPFPIYEIMDYTAPFVSGSARFDTMLIVPCSMGMLARIAQGISGDIIARTADVMLKERRRLIVVPRESPYNLIHLRNMTTLAKAGAVIAPASPHFYASPANIPALVDGFLHRLLDIAELSREADQVYRWGEEK